MNIYAKAGAKVRFLGKHGHDHQPIEAMKAGLKVDQIYTVNHTEVHNWYSYVRLVEFPKERFLNTVMFEDVVEPKNESNLKL